MRTRSRTRWTVLLLVAGLAQGAASPAQAIFHATTSLVNVAFSARDRDGKLVQDLQAADLTVSENGVPSPIAFFSRMQAMPLSLGLLLDLSPSQRPELQRHQRDLGAFLQALLGPRDRAFLLGFGDHLRVLGDFTPAPSTLMWDLSHFSPKYSYPELGPAMNRDGGTALFDAVFYAITDKLDRQAGRRVLVVFSDGEDNSSANDEARAVLAAQDNDVTIYAVRYTQTRKPQPRDQYGTYVMERLAQVTGGRSIDAIRNQPSVYLPAIAAELRSSYELGYYAPAGGAGFRSIQIVCRRPGVRVQARTGYYAQP